MEEAGDGKDEALRNIKLESTGSFSSHDTNRSASLGQPSRSDSWLPSVGAGGRAPRSARFDVDYLRKKLDKLSRAFRQTRDTNMALVEEIERVKLENKKLGDAMERIKRGNTMMIAQLKRTIREQQDHLLQEMEDSKSKVAKARRELDSWYEERLGMTNEEYLAQVVRLEEKYKRKKSEMKAEIQNCMKYMQAQDDVYERRLRTKFDELDKANSTIEELQRKLDQCEQENESDMLSPLTLTRKPNLANEDTSTFESISPFADMFANTRSSASENKNKRKPRMEVKAKRKAPRLCVSPHKSKSRVVELEITKQGTVEKSSGAVIWNMPQDSKSPQEEAKHGKEKAQETCILVEEEVRTVLLLQDSESSSSSSRCKSQIATKTLSKPPERKGPSKTNDPGYAYQEVVRGKARGDLPGHVCQDCQGMYKALKESGHLDKDKLDAIVQECSRHRYKHAPEPSTPEFYWEIPSMNTPLSNPSP